VDNILLIYIYIVVVVVGTCGYVDKSFLYIKKALAVKVSIKVVAVDKPVDKLWIVIHISTDFISWGGCPHAIHRIFTGYSQLYPQ